MSSLTAEEKLGKLLDHLQDIDGFRPIMCGVCGVWNTHIHHCWEICNICNIYVCRRDYIYNNDMSGVNRGICADCVQNHPFYK
jgi:hypothetical protein